MKIFYRILPVLVVASGVAIASGVSGAQADDPQQPTLEETFDYPAAERILQERGIRLLKGDGRITLVDCASGSGFAEVWSRSKGQACFRVTGPGYLTMEVPEVYLIKGSGGNAITATVTVDGISETAEVPKSTWVGVGEGTDPDTGPATLVELRAKAA